MFHPFPFDGRESLRCRNKTEEFARFRSHPETRDLLVFLINRCWLKEFASLPDLENAYRAIRRLRLAQLCSNAMAFANHGAFTSRGEKAVCVAPSDGTDLGDVEGGFDKFEEGGLDRKIRGMRAEADAVQGRAQGWHAFDDAEKASDGAVAFES